MTALSGWMGRVRRHGLAIAQSAAGRGLALALAALVVAGAADMIGGIPAAAVKQDCPGRVPRAAGRGLARLRRVALRGGGDAGRRAAAGFIRSRTARDRAPKHAPEKEGAQRRRVPLGTGPMGSVVGLFLPRGTG
jgi:hypothetical protein